MSERLTDRIVRLTAAHRRILDYLVDEEAQLYEAYDYSRGIQGRPTGRWFLSNKTRWVGPKYPARLRRCEVYASGGEVVRTVALQIVNSGLVDERTGYITPAGRAALHGHE